MSETATVRRIAATLTIGSFSIAALMGILALLGAGDIGDQQEKVLLTTLVVGCASICMLCYLATSGTRWAPVGVIGALALMVPTVAAEILIWHDSIDGIEPSLKTFGIGVVAAATLAQICLLLALAGARKNLAPVMWLTILLAVVAAVTVSGIILEEIDGDIWKFLGAVAILDVLGTLVTIALAKFGGRAEAPAAVGQVTLGHDQAAEIDKLARVTGRPPTELVAEAIDQYLARGLIER